MNSRPLLLLLALLLTLAPVAAQQRVLFDASHRENAGNADWIIDADAFDLNQAHYPCGGSDFENESRAQRFPTPPASGVTAGTPESYWTGGISAFGIDLVKLGFDVESLPPGASITFGDGGNVQDLSLYDVFVLPEPNQPFNAAETQAIRDFVAAGGGLFLITDHQTSDRDCDGADSPHIGNDLMGVVISGGTVTDAGLFGIVFNVEEIAGQTSADYWFTDGVDDNVSTAPGDPIIDGPHGSGAGGLGFFGATAMTLDPSANSTVQGHVWKTDAGGQGNTRVTFATASYLNGRIACIGDSSPADDGTGDSGDSLHFGWDLATGGVNNKEIHLNAVEWLAGDDLTAPLIVGTPTVVAGDCGAEVIWTTDEAAGSIVDYGPTAAYGSNETLPGLTTTHSVILSDLFPQSIYHFRVGSIDASGNGPTQSADDTFSTGASADPILTAGPFVSNVSGSSVTVTWSTDEPSDSLVRYGTTQAYGSTVSGATPTTEHSLVLSGLSATTTYHFSVESVDGCGNGPATSSDDTFTTAPASIDISGWTLRQFNSTQSFVFPPGTTIPGGGYLVLARDTGQAAFEAEWGSMPAGTTFVDSGGVIPLINGGESFELVDDSLTNVDGTTIPMSSGATIQRNNPGDPAGISGSWTSAAASAGTPGSGAGAPSLAGVVINEASDATAFQNEFVELYYDAAPAGPDTTAPEAISDLQAIPLSDTVIRLTWTAPGDDGISGTAAGYDLRHAPQPILTEAEFTAATPLTGEPLPHAAGTPELWDVTGLVSESPYFFAGKTADEVPNVSTLSVTAGGTTGSSGSGGGEPVADHLVISEIQSRGVTNQNDEFVELYNPTGAAVSLSDWSLQYKSASGTTFLRVDLPFDSVAAGGYYLVTRPAAEYSGGVTGDATQSVFLMSASGGHIFLADASTDLTSCTDARIVDKVGYGSGDCPETAAASAHAAGESLERLPGSQTPFCGNGIDTDDNSLDLAATGSPTPRNSTTVELPCVELGEVGRSLFLGSTDRDELRWAAALGASGYKIRRAVTADFMTTEPIPDDTHLLLETSTTVILDAATPAAGQCFYYFVNATGNADSESSD